MRKAPILSGEITLAELKELLQGQASYIGQIDSWDGDAVYAPIAEASYRSMLDRVPTFNPGYRRNRLDCEDHAEWVLIHIAGDFADLTKDDDPLLAHGQIWGMIPAGEQVASHSDGWFIDENRRLRLVDCQNRVILPPEKTSQIQQVFRMGIK